MIEKERETGPSGAKKRETDPSDAKRDSTQSTLSERGGQFESGLDRGTVGFLVADESLTVVGSSGIDGRLAELLPDPVGDAIDARFDDAGVEAVKRALETGETVDFGMDIGDDARFAVRAVPVAELVVVQLRDATDRVQLSREVKRSRRILDTLDDGVYTLDEAFVITSVNEAVTEITGYGREELVGSHSSMLAGDETLSMAAQILEQLRDEGSDVGLIESSIRRADGESIPIETRFSTVEFANGDRRQVGVLRDVTDRRHHERTLRELNRSTRELLRADDKRTVCETIVDVATTVWPDAAVAAYRFDKTESRLVPVAASNPDAAPRSPGTPEWEAFATGRSSVTPDGSPSSTGDSAGTDDGTSRRPTGRVIEGDADATASDNGLFASLEEHGLLTIEFGSGVTPDNAIEAVELLAANAVVALGRVERDEELSRRREELAARNDRLERLHEFNDLLRQINGALVDADTLGDVATAVCTHLVGADQVAFAWFGEAYRSGEGLQAVACAGDGDAYLDDLEVLGTEQPRLSAEGDTEPSGRALASRTPIAIPDISTDMRGSQWRKRALVRGFQSIASVPVEYNDLAYGVLSVYATRPGAFDGDLGDLLESLGGTIGNAINGLETKRSLHGESSVELELRIEDSSLLSSRLAGALGDSVRVEGVVPGDDDRAVLSLRSRADPAPLPSSVLAVEAVRAVGGDDDPRFAVTVTAPTLSGRLADYGAEVEDLRADADGVDVTLTLPQSADVRLLIEALEKGYREVELRARRERKPSERGPETFSASVTDRLTDRQREVVRTAHLSGYFEWPRASTGEEVAETLDITQPTFNRHLRTTESTLFSLLFDGIGEQ
ncbi:bacterio-opsin activator domain-containing protein [Halorubrum lipolyticum]|uniref:PAS domain S-box n=1 Tax=Halorubrum lipolyticum DSM 21995 TaxID=1227482 RepID=M0NR67_9EURY|nr:bacterio-opsin activator domain-containing protein [Halorubrum lipolyticum]EMA59125.1 PAS domain S-box [Halorubrum lipolyticum DSM 21995]